MARIDTVRESNGPDRFNIHPGCASHHAGVRTGIKDYCCCCDPCNYVRKNESATEPELRHCCRCLPRLILAKFTATNGNACCRNVVVPMLAGVGTTGGEDVIVYSGSIVGHSITIYISNSAIGAYADLYDTGCRWTILIPSLGVSEEVSIDHTTVTCLGVPAISVTGVTAYDGCVGTISLNNYATVKVPFRTRFPSEEVDDSLSITVPFPDGFENYECTDLPRYICITKKHNRINRVRSPKIPWEIEWWRDFAWDEEFEPYFDEDQQQWIIGRWRHNPKDTTAFIQHLYLIQDLYGGDTFLQPDFESPGGTDGEGETYQRVPLTSCGCDFKILDVRPVDDPSPPPEQGRPDAFEHDLLGIDYRGGRCGCWDYQCGKRRCVPKYLCGFLYVNQTLYRNILFTWSNSLKCWVAGGGVDLDGYPMPFDLNVCLTQNDEGQCQLSVDYEDYSIDPVAIGDTNTVIGGTLSGSNYAMNDYFTLNLTTSFDGDCELLLTCVTATPCYVDCGSHPELLHLRLYGWSLPSDIPPPPASGSCTLEMDLIYYQRVVVSGTGVLITCEYIGYAIVNSFFTDLVTGLPSSGPFLITAKLNLGQLRITRTYIGAGSAAGAEKFISLQTETCDPYYGYYFTLASLQNCFFGDTATFFHRWEAEITE